ncbi:MAG: PQQ-dependent sugar dehydrogenase [Paracoccaceae bacterium]
MGLAFLPDGGFLVTERDSGRLLLFAGPDAEPVALSGLPKVAAVGQGGLLDVMVPRDFAESREIYLSHSVDGFRNLATALASAGFPRTARRWKGFAGSTGCRLAVATASISARALSRRRTGRCF